MKYSEFVRPVVDKLASDFPHHLKDDTAVFTEHWGIQFCVNTAIPSPCRHVRRMPLRLDSRRRVVMVPTVEIESGAYWFGDVLVLHPDTYHALCREFKPRDGEITPRLAPSPTRGRFPFLVNLDRV